VISWHVTQASSYAADVDSLILQIALIVGAFFLAAEFILVWLVFKFRARPGVKARYITGEKTSETKWVSYPHYLVLVFDIIIVVAALRGGERPVSLSRVTRRSPSPAGPPPRQSRPGADSRS